ncbi:hypothetical protein [Flavobacterium procerum]|uniref:hypothetical protein n=1 Tax=Flavobacterium procerum TaxID=1455569 RepID=UPI00406BB418
MTLGPRARLVAKLKTPEQKATVEAYIEKTSKRSERELYGRVKKPFLEYLQELMQNIHSQKEPIPVWIGDYVWLVMELERLWRFLVERKRITLLLIFFKVKTECRKSKTFSQMLIFLKLLTDQKTTLKSLILDFLNGLD